MLIYLETSSYLPLIWITPYSQSVIALMTQRLASGYRFALQRDCVTEASGYLSFKDDWRYNPVIRFQRVADAFTDTELASLSFPSAAMQILLGGNIWPQAQYLNFVRHTGFFFADILDTISFQSPRTGLQEAAQKIGERIENFRTMFMEHQRASIIRLPQESILPYWGRWYLPKTPMPFQIQIVDDVRPYNMTTDKLRDIYHYDCAVNAPEQPKEMIVANTGFQKNVKTSFTHLPLPIVCGETITSSLFGGSR